MNLNVAAKCFLVFTTLVASQMLLAQQATSPNPPVNANLPESVRNSFPPRVQSLPLYGNEAIPNSIENPDKELTRPRGSIVKVSHPTLEVFLPAKVKANGASIIIFPGGGYIGLTWVQEGPSIGQFFQDHGIAAFVVKYRLPDDTTMQDKSIGPLQDSQQTMLIVRQRAKEWGLDPQRETTDDFYSAIPEYVQSRSVWSAWRTGRQLSVWSGN